MKTYQIKIGNPCHELWENMTITEQGRHCASCNKVVVDFTHMTNTDIINYLLEKKGQRVCGNFYKPQIQHPITVHPTSVKHKWPVIAAMLVAGLFSFYPVQAQQPTTGRQVYKTSIDKDLKRETEPGNDSSKVYTLTILSSTDQIPIPLAKVKIKSFGEFVSDVHGNIKVDLTNKKIPQTFTIEINASGYEFATYQIKSGELTANRSYKIYLKEYEKFMLRGDISIDEVH